MTAQTQTPVSQQDCPICQKFQATYYATSQNVCVMTDEYDSDDDGNEFPVYETLTARGWLLICPLCGTVDGEPNQL